LILHYILDEQGLPIPEPDFIKWAQWYDKADRQVAETFFGALRVSTVFLGLPNPDRRSDAVDMLYETMVFADEATLARLLELSETDDRSIIALFTGSIDIQKRYRSREEATQGHKRMCIFIETCIAAGLLQLKDVTEA